LNASKRAAKGENLSLRLFAIEKPNRKLRSVFGPQGHALYLSDLPPSDCGRWSKRKKLEVVLAVKGGLLSLEEACSRYRMSVEEFRAWEKLSNKRVIRKFSGL
jgi:hypothetical protein